MMEAEIVGVFAKRRPPLEWVLLGISALCIGELLYAPHLALLKDWGGAPALRFPGVTTSIAELAVMCFIAVGGLMVLQRCALRKTIDLGPPRVRVLVAVLLVALSFSVALGVALGNREFARDFRMELLSPLLFLIFLNLNLSETFEAELWKVLVAGSTLILAEVLLFYLAPGLIGVTTVPRAIFSTWYALVVVLLVAAVSLARLVFRGFSVWWTAAAAAAVVTVTLYLSAKPVVLGLLVILLLIPSLALASKRLVIIMRGVAIVVAIPLLVAAGVAVTPASLQVELGRTLAARFLKQTNVRDVEDLRLALDVVTSGAGDDITEGRFDIWQMYVAQTPDGLGFAPAGFGHAPPMRIEGRSTVGFPPHNLLVYYGYHGGLLSALSILGLIAWFGLAGFAFVSQRLPRQFHLLDDYQLIGGYAFILSVTTISLVTTTAHANDLRVGWVYWMVAVVIVRRFRISRSTATA
jgi:hypothetical protein